MSYARKGKSRQSATVTLDAPPVTSSCIGAYVCAGGGRAQAGPCILNDQHTRFNQERSKSVVHNTTGPRIRLGSPKVHTSASST